jgi:Flp pilus assembly protein TadD
VARGDAAGATRAFERARELSPSEPRLSIYLGHAHELARHYDLAEQAYRRAVAVASDRAWTHRVLGSRLLRWGRPEEAIEPLARAWSLDSAHAETLNAYAIALSQAGRFEQAEQQLRKGAGQFPEHAGFGLGLSVLLLSQGKLREALANYDAMALRFPQLGSVQVGRSLVLLELGRQKDAQTALDRAIALDPTNVRYRTRLVRSRAATR